MAYFDCIVGGSGKGNTLVVTCADNLAGATITCTNGTKTYTKTCPSTAPYEVTFYGLMDGTWTVSATVSGTTYTTTVVVADIEALLGGFSWRAWVNLSQNYTSSDFTDLDDLLSDETAIRELMTIHACVDYLAGIAAASADVEQIIENDYCAKWINLRDYALDTLYANEIIADYMDTADKYGYGEWALMPQVPTMTSDTTPYGEASCSSRESSNTPAYLAFNGTTNASGWMPASSDSFGNAYVAYEFVNDAIITRVTHYWYHSYGTVLTMNIKYQGLNSSNVWEDLTDEPKTITTNTLSTFDINAEKKPYKKYRALLYSQGTGLLTQGHGHHLQFYAYAPKGNVPVMTSDTAPYGEASASDVNTDAYKAFLTDANTSWRSTSDRSPGYSVEFKYHFVNPIEAKKATITARHSTYNSRCPSMAITISASNDDLTWKVLGTGTINFPGGDVYASFTELTSVLNTSTAYEYYKVKVEPNLMAGYVASYNVMCIQFYGRELSVSVPTMTSNTAPYGEASASTQLNTNYAAYKAFSTSGTWYPNKVGTNMIGEYLQYEFTNKVVVKALSTSRSSDGGTVVASTWTVLGSNDNFVSDINEIQDITIQTSSIAELHIITNTIPYKYYRLRCKTNPLSSGNNNYFGLYAGTNFYGLDYSEREFETGVTKKWLYDHGVELEELTFGIAGSNASYTKNSNDVLLSKGATNGASAYMVTSNTIDLINYDLLRMKAGEILLTATCGCITVGDSYSTVDAYSNIVLGNNPNTYSLSVSSFNQSKKITARNTISGTDAQKMTVKELWLE